MCDKVRFAKRALAIQRISEIAKKEEGKKPIRAYHCKECGGYHLTSAEMRSDQKAIIGKRKKYYPERIATHYINKNKW
jgi:uncharacterized protein YlaI